MATDKAKLRKLINFVSEVAHQEADSWFIRELVQSISESDANPITHQVLNEIHEHCIKNIINKQAEGFYSNFIISNIKPKLIEDYALMEHHKREDNFEEFCFKAHQQIEQIINTIFTETFLKEITTKLDNNAYTIPDGNGGLTTASLGNLIYRDYNGAESSIEWTYLQKVKAILYAYWIKSNPRNEVIIKIEEFNDSLYHPARDIYLIRNLNHRGNNIIKDTQHHKNPKVAEYIKINKENVDIILKNKHRNYQRFSGYLFNFVKIIQNHYQPWHA